MEQTVWTRPIGWGAAAVLALGLTACGAGGDGGQDAGGGASPSGTDSSAAAAPTPSPESESDADQAPRLSEVWPEARQQLDEATSVRITGRMPSGRDHADIDYRGQLDGSNYHTVVETDGGDVVDVISDGDIAHAHLPDAALDRMGPPGKVKDLLDGQRVQQPESSLGVGVEILFQDITQNLPEGETWDGEDTEATVVEEDGRTLYSYPDTERRGVILFDAQDRSLAGLRQGESAVGSEGAGSARPDADTLDAWFAFSEWNAVESVPMPDEDETVTEDELVALIITGD
ncbi:hypothetical protein [Micrococcus terreus]|uniref:hypothetical protein n=1 Tax=Micrococcus terreus TaxID=574650 RepID=UPI0030199863